MLTSDRAKEWQQRIQNVRSEIEIERRDTPRDTTNDQTIQNEVNKLEGYLTQANEVFQHLTTNLSNRAQSQRAGG